MYLRAETRKKRPPSADASGFDGAEEGIRTLDPVLGKDVLYR